jgi:hypothetical protein
MSFGAPLKEVKRLARGVRQPLRVMVVLGLSVTS